MILNLANIGPELRDLRALRGMKRIDLARRIAKATGGNAKTLESQLWAWETGKTEPTPSTVAAILAALGYRAEVRATPPTPARRPLLDARLTIAPLPTVDVVHSPGCTGMRDAIDRVEARPCTCRAKTEGGGHSHGCRYITQAA